MDRTAGFAASIAIRQELIQSLVRVMYNAGRIGHFMNFSTPVATANLFLSLPTLSYQPNSGNRLTIDLLAWGPMSITPPGGTTEARRVAFRARVTVAQTASIAAGQLTFGLDTSTVAVSSYEIDPYAGGLFSQATVDYLVSPDFVSLLTLGLRAQLTAFGQFLPPLNVLFLGAIALDPSVRVSHVTVDEAIVLGLDVSTAQVTTHGNPGALIDSSGGNDIGFWIRPSVIEVAYPDVRTEIEKKVVKAGATLDSYHLRVEEGWLSVTGSASETGGSVNFSVHAVPKLVRPGVHYEWDEEYGEHFEYTTPSREELWFDAQDVVVDVVKDWWVVLIEAVGGILTVGLGVLVVEAVVDMVQGNVTSGIEQDAPSRAQRNQAFTINGVSRPAMQLRIEEYECHAEGVFTGLTITALFWAAYLTGPTRISVEEALVETLRYRVDLPPDTLPDDPELRVRWTVRRTDTNAVLVSTDTAALGRLSLSLDQTIVPFLEVDRISIEVRVYRTLGAGSVDLFYKLQALDITDYVDRTHPFVQWSHQSLVPMVRVEADGGHTVLGANAVGRRSAIHRTALPGRCRMLRCYSLQRIIPADGAPFVLEYTDTLPFPLSELIARRAEVCDYCFFGGPTRSVPLIPVT